MLVEQLVGCAKTKRIMKIKISTEQLVSGMEPLKTVIQSGSTIPILDCVKVEMYEGKLYFTGDNQEINCVSIIEIDNDNKFSFCVKYATFSALVNNLPEQEAELTINDNEIKVRHKNGDFKLPTFLASDFPKPRTENTTGSAKVKGVDIKRSLKMANKFTLNSSLELMSNVSIDINKTIVVRSTNRSTLFREVLKGKGDKAMLLISGKASGALHDMLGDKKVKLQYSNNLLILKSDSFEMTIVQQIGDYPVASFDKIIESGGDAKKLKLNFSSLIESLKRLSVIADASTYKVKFSLSKKNLTVTSMDLNESTFAHEVIKAKFPETKEVGYNLKFLGEILSVTDDDAEFSIVDSGLMFMTGKNRIAIVAPMQLDKTD